MKIITKSILAVLILTGCASILKPITETYSTLIEDYTREVQLDSCEKNLIELILSKRIAEHSFPTSITDLSHIDLKKLLDTIKLSDSELVEYGKDLKSYESATIKPWFLNCKDKFDKINFKPYGQDSIDVIWVKHENLKQKKIKLFSEDWMIKVKADTSIDFRFVDMKIEIIDSTGKTIYTMKCNDEDFGKK